MRPLPVFSSKVFFAPMAGISDPALRLLCKQLGAGLVVTELNSVHAILTKEKKLSQLRESITSFIPFSAEEKPLAVQLFGSDIPTIVKAATIVEPFFDIIDFNMGCPAPHITAQMAGASLLQKEEHTRELLTALVRAVKKPVSVKMRAGATEHSRHLFLRIGKIAEQAGVSLLTLHPRTVAQGYSGKADWNLIKQLKEHVCIPVVGNGDIQTPQDAQEMMSQTGCDYVMIGRAAAKNPFLFKQIKEYMETGTYKEITFAEQLSCFFSYLNYAKPYTLSLAHIRMQAMNFTKGGDESRFIRQKIASVTSLEELELLLRNYVATVQY